MSLVQMFQSLPSAVARREAVFAASRASFPGFASAAELSRGLRGVAADTGARAAHLRAIVREYQKSLDPLWQALLFIAFGPMLRRLRGRAGRWSDEDLDQRVLMAFLDAARAVCLEDRSRDLAAQLRWDSEDRVRAAYRRDRARERRELPDDGESDAACPSASPFVVARLREALRAARDHGGEDLVAALVETAAGGESLKAYVDRTYPSLTARERAAVCRRLRRERQAFLTRLRRRLAA